jgi:anti-sigma B factor antagonist
LLTAQKAAAWQGVGMEMQIALVENVAHVKLRGRLDTHGVDEIETKLTASVVPGGHNALVDLSEVSFVTSMALRMFLAISKALRRHNAKMVLIAPQPQASEVFASAHLSSIIPIVGMEAEALALLS